MASERRVLHRGQVANLEAVSDFEMTAYFIRAQHPEFRRKFDTLPEAEAFWRSVEDGTANPDLP